jgi:hypothetical protein
MKSFLPLHNMSRAFIACQHQQGGTRCHAVTAHQRASTTGTTTSTTTKTTATTMDTTTTTATATREPKVSRDVSFLYDFLFLIYFIATLMFMLGPFGTSERRWQPQQQDTPDMWTTGKGQKDRDTWRLKTRRVMSLGYFFFFFSNFLSYILRVICRRGMSLPTDQTGLDTRRVSSLFHHSGSQCQTHVNTMTAAAVVAVGCQQCGLETRRVSSCLYVFFPLSFLFFTMLMFILGPFGASEWRWQQQQQPKDRHK